MELLVQENFHNNIGVSEFMTTWLFTETFTVSTKNSRSRRRDNGLARDTTLDISQHFQLAPSKTHYSRWLPNQTDKTDHVRIWIREFVDSNLDSWIRNCIRGFQTWFENSNLDSWIRSRIRGFEVGFVGSKLNSWIGSWIRGFQIGFQLTVYDILSVADPLLTSAYV